MENSDLDLFAEFLDYTPPIKTESCAGICPECRVPMSIINHEYSCLSCGLISTYTGDENLLLENRVGCIRISGGKFGGKFFSINSDYTRTQKKSIMDQLTQNNNNYLGAKFPRDVLVRVASAYNEIQKISMPIMGADTTKKFVKRGNTKDQVMASLIFYECIRSGLTRKKKDIAVMMRLHSSGFCKGDDIVRRLNADGHISIPDYDNALHDFAERYLEALCIEGDPDHYNFIVEIVALSESNKIGMSSQMSSKLAGIIWILVCRKRLNISYLNIEIACDNCKKNTFIKFCRVVENRDDLFGTIFDKYGINH